MEASVHEPVSALLCDLPRRTFVANETGPERTFSTFRICILRTLEQHALAPLTLRDDDIYALPFLTNIIPSRLSSTCRAALKSVANNLLPPIMQLLDFHTATGFWYGVDEFLRLGQSSPALIASQDESVKATTIRFRASGNTVRFDKYDRGASDSSLPLATIVGKMMSIPRHCFADEVVWATLAQAMVSVGPKVIGSSVRECAPRSPGDTPAVQRCLVMSWAGANLGDLEPSEVSDNAFKAFFRRYRNFNVRAASSLRDSNDDFLRAGVTPRATLALLIKDIRDLLDTVDTALESMSQNLEDQSSSSLSPDWRGWMNDIRESRTRISRHSLSTAADAVEQLEEMHAPRRLLACHGELHTGNVTYLSPTTARTEEKRLYAVDWSDGYMGPWFLESLPLAQYFDMDGGGVRQQKLLDMFLQSVGDKLHPGLTLQRATAIFDAARPFRYLRRFVMAARMFEYRGELDSITCKNLLLDCNEYLKKAAGALLNDQFCRDEDTNWSDCDDLPPLADIPPSSSGPTG